MFSYFSSRLGLPSSSSSSFQDHLADADSVDADDVSSSGRSLSLPWPVTESRAKHSPGFLNTMSVPMNSTTPRRDFAPPPTRGTTKNIVISNPIPRTQPNHLAAALTPPPPQPAPLPSSSKQAPVYPQNQGFRPTPLPQPQYIQQLHEADITGAYDYERTPSRRGLYPQSRFGHRNSIPPSGSYIPYAPPEVVRLDSGAEDGEETVVGEISDSDPFREKEDKTREKKRGSQSPKTSPYAYSPPTRPYEYTSHPSASSYALPIPDETKSISSIRSISSAKSTSTAASVVSTATSLKRHLTISNPLQSLTGSKKSPASEVYLSPFTINDRDHTSSGAQRTYSYSETPSLSNASSRSEFNLDASKLDAFPPVPSSSPLGFMSKSRWNLGLNNPNTPNLRVQTPSTKINTTRPQAIYEDQDNEEEDIAQTPMPMHMPNTMHPTVMPSMPNGLYTHKKPVPVAVPAPLSLDVPTDVYAHAYGYPLAKQLSPIAEQDYISPTTAAASDSQSVRFGRGGDASSLRVDFEYPRLRKETSRSGTGSISARSFSIKEKEQERGKEKEKEKETIREEVVAEKESDKEKEVLREKEKRTRMGSGRSGSGGSASDITRPSPIYTPTSASGPSPFLTRHLNMNRTTSQTSSKSDGQQQVYSQQAGQTSAVNLVPRPASNPTNLSQSREAQTPPATAMTPQQTPTSAVTTSMFTPTSTFGVQTPIATSMPIVGGSGPSANPYPIQIQIPAAAVLGRKDSASIPQSQPPQPPQPIPLVQDNTTQPDRSKSLIPKIPSLPVIAPLDLRFSRNSNEVRPPAMPVIESVEDDGSEDESYDEEDTEEDIDFEEDEDDEYDHESLHADSFVTADGNETIGLELIAPSTPRLASASASSTRSTSVPVATPGGSSSTTTGDSFIHRRWDREAGLGFGTGSSSVSPTGNTTTFRAKAKDLFFSHYTPAFWTFWLGFIFPVLWLIGGWHFTNKGEMPPKYTVWEWYFWRRGSGWFKSSKTKKGADSEVNSPVGKKVSKKGSDLKSKGKGRKKGKSAMPGVGGQGAATSPSGAVTSPALPRWIAERLSTDDGRLRRLTHDPKRSLRGISFGYPFVPRPPTYSLGASSSFNPFGFVLRVLDLLYGVKLREVHGRPESARRMFDPWIQRCRYALCLAIIALAIGMLAACIYLIVVVV